MEFSGFSSVESLILSVKKRPELWDTSCDSYKDRHDRAEGWNTVCCEVIADFNEKDKADQMAIEKTLITKWRTVRDGYIKAKKKQLEECRNGPGSKRTHPYIYGDRLQFLDKVTQFKVSEDPLQCDQTDTEDVNVHCKTELGETPPKRRRGFRGARARKGQPSPVMPAPEPRCEAVDDDDHLSFFKSLLPSLKKLNDTQLLAFRIQTMQNLQQLLLKQSPSQ